MLPIKKDVLARWRMELQQAESFKEKNFGVYLRNKRSGVGNNLDYFEEGQSLETQRDPTSDVPFTTLNIIFPIVKNIIPSLYFQNPKVLALPRRNKDQDSAPVAAEILNYYHKELNFKEVNQHVIFDAYILGMGVCKLGYATKFGADIQDEKEQKRKEKSKIRKFSEAIGLVKPKPEEKKENPELNEFIRTESPFNVYVNPFDFGIDPRATSIYNATYVYHKVKKTLKQVKSNSHYSNTKDLKSSEIEGVKDLSQSELENFQTIDLYEIWYKTEKGLNILTIAKDQNEYRAIYHEESPYEIDGFPFEVLTFNKHGHKLYPVSDLTVVSRLQDRLTTTFDSILDQVDRYVSKVIVDENALTESGKVALENGELGAVCWANKDPNSVVKELNMTQVKSDMMALVERIIDIISLQVGLTRAQLTGLTSAKTATEAQIGQAGQNLRRNDQQNDVMDFVNRQSRKFWQIVTQFVDLEELELITGEGMTTPQGYTQYSWLDVTPEMREKLIKGEYSFDIEVGSAQKPNIEVIRQQAFNFVIQAFNPVVDQLLMTEGTQLNHTELLRGLIKLMPEVYKNPERILQQITPERKTQLQQGQVSSPSKRGNSPENAQGNIPRTPPTAARMQEETFGERRMGI